MTRPREWPNWAAEARDRAAEAAIEAIRAIEPLVRGEAQFDRTETLRRQAIALNALQRVARLMESVGAKTRAE